MTIAACYLSPEGVVLGADSTSTYGSPGSHHYFNNAQKLFEVGQDATLGVVTWGLGGLNAHSYRTLLALLGDALRKKRPKTVGEVATRWIEQFWRVYTEPKSPLAPFFQRCAFLKNKQPYDAVANPPNPAARTEPEEREFETLSGTLVVGFCIGGYVASNRTAEAFEIIFDPNKGKPVSRQLPMGWQFWGAPNMIQRLIFGCDDGIKAAIRNSGKWVGTAQELDLLVGHHTLSHPIVPIRDAIDFVHACILSTIKAFKFSTMSQICGGPIELAVITTDRHFRWVRHKQWDAAITEGETYAP